ncbi:MAG: hypothetical protein E6Q73_09635 [Pseudorhodobacter sp.]|nr:MAG: hypothetical protein E6Q73_09635 [Pseudorhodobacter sp.]
MASLETLLDEVAAKTRAGDFTALGALSARLEASLAELVKQPPGPGLDRLRQKAEQNARLLDAARRGIKAARRRIEDARQVAQRLQTYDIAGKKSDIAVGATTTGRF